MQTAKSSLNLWCEKWGWIEVEIEAAHELLMNLNLNSTFAKSMNLNLFFSKSMNLNLVFSKSMNSNLNLKITKKMNGSNLGFNRLDRPVEESRPDRFLSLGHYFIGVFIDLLFKINKILFFFRKICKSFLNNDSSFQISHLNNETFQVQDF